MADWLPNPGDLVQVVSQEGHETCTARCGKDLRLIPATIGSIWVVRHMANSNTWVVARPAPQGTDPLDHSANLDLRDVRPYPVPGQPQVAKPLPWDGLPLG